MKVKGKGKGRTVKCDYCGLIINRSIVPHIRKKHPESWKNWCKRMLKSYNEGLNAKQIMKRDFDTLFTWKVIEKEIQRMVEEGCDIKYPIRENIENWSPSDSGKLDNLNFSTVWHFRKRGKWATHSGIYRGNWTPEIPRYLILNYTKEKELVLDCFMGGGTTIVECLLLGRNAIGFDINPYAFELTKKQIEVLRRESKMNKIKLLESDIELRLEDARNIKKMLNNSIDFICTHPPYYNSLKYTYNIKGDFSRLKNIDTFLEEMTNIAGHLNRILKENKYCAILIGDVRYKRNIYPLGFSIMNLFLEAGFSLSDIIIKQQYNDRSSEFYIKSNFRRINHEYLFIFKKSKNNFVIT